MMSYFLEDKLFIAAFKIIYIKESSEQNLVLMSCDYNLVII